MGVSLKSQRKISVQGRTYYWHVAQDDDGPGMLLTVFSPDKKFIVRYELNQAPEIEQVTIFESPRKNSKSAGCRGGRFRCPRFATEAVTPGNVRLLIEWCLEDQTERQEVDWRGLPI
jgi:hypothetical protein